MKIYNILSTLKFLKKNKVLNYNYSFKKRKFIKNTDNKIYHYIIKHLKYLRISGVLYSNRIIKYNIR